MQPSVADVVGATVAAQGVEEAFGVIGSGNLVVTNALRRNGAQFHHARHENGAVCMADGYARVSGRVGACSVHQGPGLTNAITGIAEAAKSRTPLLVLAGETPAAALDSNFRIDQHDLVESVGAIADRVHGPDTAADDAQRAYERAQAERRPVVLMLPIDIQAQRAFQLEPSSRASPPPARPYPEPAALERARAFIANAQRPAIIAGRGAVLSGAGPALQALGERIGAILATSAPAHGLFAQQPFNVGIAGGFASPVAAELIQTADLVIAAGASLNPWTTKHGALIAPTASVIRIDLEPKRADLQLLADARAAAEALTRVLSQPRTGFRTPDTRQRIATGAWRNEPYEDAGTDTWVDPRSLTKALNELLPRDRAVAVDSGHFLGYPAMYLDVPNPRAWVFPNGFQAVGLGLGNAIGAAIAAPHRPTVAALGDGGAFMALAELETAVRLKLMLLALIYDDAAYGAEVHHFEPIGHDVSLVRFPDADLAGIARAAGARAATVRTTTDLEPIVEEWLINPPGPLVLDAKVNPTICAEWLEEAFRAG